MTSFGPGGPGRGGVKRELRLYLALAACYFGLYSLFLTVVPSWANRYGIGSVQAGVLVAVIAATGLMGDSVVARINARFGSRNVILTGIGIMSVASALLVVAAGFAMFIMSTVLLGLALAMMLSPILSGLSSHAGEDQLPAQSTNASWQRLGALVTSLFLLNALSTSNRFLVVIAMSLLLGVLLVLALLLRPRDRDQLGSSAAESLPRASIACLVGTSHHLQAGLISNASTALLVIIGSSFFPLVLIALHKPGLLTAGLVGREVLAIAAALVVRRIPTRTSLGRFWLLTAVVGAIGLVVFPFVESDIVLILAFSLHGAAVGSGIVLGNAKIYDGTTQLNRIQGFAASAMLGRIASIIFPLLLGLALGISTGLAMATTAVIVGVAVILYLRLARNYGI